MFDLELNASRKLPAKLAADRKYEEGSLMPGRPRMTLKRLNELAERAEAYGSDLFNLVPAQYRDRQASNDPTGEAWRRAADAAITNYQALNARRELVAQKVARAEQLKSIMEEGRR